MFRLRSLLAAVFAVAFAFGPIASAAQNAPHATISGRAQDTAGKALVHVLVTLEGPVHKTATTDVRGIYTIDVPAGLYSLTATLAGYEPASAQDIAIAAGQNVTGLDVTMSGATLQSLRTIATVRTSATRSVFNTSGLAVSTMDAGAIDARVQPNLSKVVAELPGVVASQNAGGRDPNSSWNVRGARIETKVAIDGHTVSTGVSGTYNTIFANSEIFDQVEVLKGAGINGVNAGESAFGTINLRTRGFTGNNTASATVATDIFGSSHYFFNFEHAFSDKFAVLAARSFQGYLGPDNNVAGPVANTLGGNIVSTPGYTGLGLVQWQLPLSHPFVTTADLVKARFKFSSATSLTAEYLNLVGRYDAQGASYAYDYGPFTVAQCANGTTTVAAGAAGCTASSVYNNPRQLGYVGTTQNLFSFFPNSTINNQEPQFSLELKTTVRNDTVFVRPYWTEIRRNIDGSQENLQPGNGGGWYQVTNPANCTVQFSAPGSPAVIGGVGAAGPCFSAGDGYTTPYVNNTSASIAPIFQTTTNVANCSAATPCYTTPTSQQRNGQYGYGGPFSQPEFDKLGGVTFSWLHPVREDLYSLNADYSSDYTTKATADMSTLPAGCRSVVSPIAGQNVPTLSDGVTANPYYQPNCQIGGAVFSKLPTNAVGIPPTWNRKLALSLSGLWQINPKLQVGLGNYITFERLYYQYTDPNAIAAAAALKTSTGVSLNGAEQSDATLLGGIAAHAHYDPHFQLQYRLNPNVSLRASAGSSITTPYASLVSGFGAFSPNTTANLDALRLPNPNLQPETTVSYNVGMDQRMRDGAVLSIDLFDNNIHNVFVTYGNLVAPLPGRPPSITGMIQSQTINGPNQLSFGAEATIQRAPRVGLGYYASVTAQRAFFYNFSNTFYQTLLANGNTSYIGIVNGKQLDGTVGFQDQIPYFKGKGELNFMFPQQRAYAALGFVYNGNNNPFGVPAFITSYANARYKLHNDLVLGVSAENLLNFTTGYFNGQVIANGGFQPVGVKWNPACNCLINGPVFGTKFPNASAVVVQPRNLYFTITKKI